MAVVAFRHATVEDWPAVATLLNAARLPLAGAREHIDRFLLGHCDNQIVATAAVEAYGKHGLLRSVAVQDAVRGQGTGEEIVRRCLDHAFESGIASVTLLTTTAPDFFERFGFQRIARDEVDAAVQRSAEFCGACPESAVSMRLSLTTPPILIRRASPGDADAIARIYNQGIEDGATLETERRSAEDRASWLASRSVRHPVLVAVRRGTAVGWVALAPFNVREAYRFVADLGIYVAREARGQGVGSRLLADALRHARDLGFHKVVLTTFPTLTAALALYARFGFRIVGDYQQQGKLEGRWVDTRIMERILS